MTAKHPNSVPPRIVYPPGPIERQANTVPRGTLFGGGGFLMQAWHASGPLPTDGKPWQTYGRPFGLFWRRTTWSWMEIRTARGLITSPPEGRCAFQVVPCGGARKFYFSMDIPHVIALILTPDLGCGIVRDVGCGMCNMQCRMWGVGCGTRNLRFGK